MDILKTRRGRKLLLKFEKGKLTREEHAELVGYWSFPHNLCAAELVRRSMLDDDLTLAERGELAGWWTFPDNARGVYLVQKSMLNQISKNERAELAGLYTFPHCPRWAYLVELSYLGALSAEEWKELRVAYNWCYRSYGYFTRYDRHEQELEDCDWELRERECPGHSRATQQKRRSSKAQLDAFTLVNAGLTAVQVAYWGYRALPWLKTAVRMYRVLK